MPVTPNHPLPSDAFEGLSVAARRAWGKHDRDTDGWLPLRQHMADSAAVAGKLWDAWLPRNVKELIAESLPEAADDGRRLAVWLAASHDAGKATPAFACQVESLAAAMEHAGLKTPLQKQFGDDRKLAPHGLAGQLLIQEWLEERHGWPTSASGQFAIVAGGHHGVPPGHQKIHDLILHPELLRTPGASEAVWKGVQFELLDACARAAGVEHRFEAWRTVKLSQPVQVALTAIVILSDWIASSAELFPYLSVGSSDEGPGRRTAEGRLRAAWEGLDLPGAWAPDEPAETAAELFAARFQLPKGARIRPVQEEAVRIAREMDPAGLLIIEAPMGEGKTEAALAAAEILAARTGAGGCLVALPTRATGDAMFRRLLTWLERLPGDGSRSVFLAHAKAALNDDWAGLVRRGRRTIAAVDTDGSVRLSAPGARTRRNPAGLQAHQWLRGRKKGLLASFTVGTIDQVLFASLKSRHLALRHLALAGKVVVIDEVHAYDAYMNAYLERVMEWLAAYRVPVVLLSATLPAGPSARAGLGVRRHGSCRRRGARRRLSAVDRRRPERKRDDRAAARGVGPPYGHPPGAVRRRRGLSRTSARSRTRRRRMRVGRTEHRRSGAGSSRAVAGATSARTTSLSRTPASWPPTGPGTTASCSKAFGPDGTRPEGAHIVVASQVVEQSLDIDFDLLVTDLAPVDLMLQRMGRLHRHPRMRPPRLRTARCLVTGTDWRSDPPEPSQRFGERVRGPAPAPPCARRASAAPRRSGAASPGGHQPARPGGLRRRSSRP